MNERGRSITSDVIIEFHNQMKDKYYNDDKYIEKSKKLSNEIMKFEQQLMTTSPSCPISLLENLRDRSSHIKNSRLKQLVSEKFYDPNVMEAAMCATESVVFLSNNDPLKLNNRIRSHIHNLKLLSSGMEGMTMVGDFIKLDDFYVLKVPKNKSQADLLHEAIVGLYGTNMLRQYIPNFAYIYGLFSCSPPLIGKDEFVKSWCLNNKNNVNYILYENITPAEEVSRFLRRCSASEFLQIFMQILHSLQTAVECIDFTHYDLNHNNVLVKFMGKTPVMIKYKSTDNKDIYLKTKILAMIIDYNMSHIKVNNKHLGDADHSLSTYGVDAEKSYIMHDAYKFFMFCMYNAKRANNIRVLRVGETIFKYFNTIENLSDAIDKQFHYFYMFPPRGNSWNVLNLIKFVKQNCHCHFIFDSPDATPILQCDKMCLSKDQALSEIYDGLDKPVVAPNNVIDFYDLYFRLQNEGRMMDQSRVISTFDYTEAMKQHVSTIADKTNKIVTPHKLFIKHINYLKQRKNLIDITYLPDLRDLYDNITSLVDRLTELKLYYKIGIAVAESYEDENSINKMKESMRIVQSVYGNIIPEIINFMNHVKETSDQVLRDMIQPGKQEVSSADLVKKFGSDEILWFWTDRKTQNDLVDDINTNIII